MEFFLKSDRRRNGRLWPPITSTPSHQPDGTVDFAALPLELQNVVNGLLGERRIQTIVQRDAVVDTLFSKMKNSIEEYNLIFLQKRNRVFGEIAVLQSSITLFQQMIAEKKAQLESDQVYIKYNTKIKAFFSSK